MLKIWISHTEQIYWNMWDKFVSVHTNTQLRAQLYNIQELKNEIMNKIICLCGIGCASINWHSESDLSFDTSFALFCSKNSLQSMFRRMLAQLEAGIHWRTIRSIWWTSNSSHSFGQRRRGLNNSHQFSFNGGRGWCDYWCPYTKEKGKVTFLTTA